MVEEYSREMLRKSVAKVIMEIGFVKARTYSLNILVDAIIKYIKFIGRRARSYTELFNKSNSDLFDVAFAFRDLGINMGEMKNYVKYFKSPTPDEVPKYPISREPHLISIKRSHKKKRSSRHKKKQWREED